MVKYRTVLDLFSSDIVSDETTVILHDFRKHPETIKTNIMDDIFKPLLDCPVYSFQFWNEDNELAITIY